MQNEMTSPMANAASDVECILEDSGVDTSLHRNTPSTQHRTYYTLPLLRYRNLLFLLFLADLTTIIVLWLIAGHTDFFIKNFKEYDFLYSVVDVAGVTLAKVILLWIVYTCLEDASMKSVQSPYDSRYLKTRNIWASVAIVGTFLFLLFFAIKGAMIFNCMVHDGDYKGMSHYYYAVVISSIAFTSIEFMVSWMSFQLVKKLKEIRILHTVNQFGQELDKDGNVVKEKVDIRRLVKLAKPEAGILSLATLSLFIGAATQTAAPYYFGLVVDAALRSMAQLNRTVLILVLIYVAGSMAAFIRSWLYTLAGHRLVARLRKDLFASIIRQEIAFFDVTRTGELTNRLSSDSQVIQNAVTVNISMLVRYILQIVGSLIVMFILNAKLTGVLLSVVPIVSIVAVQYGSYLMKLQKDFQDRLADASTSAEENISSVRTVKTFYGEDKATAAYGYDVDRSFAIGRKLAFLSGIFQAVIGTVASGAACLVLWYGGKLVYEGQVSPGILTAFLLYTLQVSMAFAFLSSLYGDFMKAVGASFRIFELMDRMPKVGHEHDLEIPNAFDNSIEFDCVHFTYPARPDTEVLKGVSFSVSKGQMIALVGPSGGGKSTIVNLIERFYDPDSGVVNLGGSDVKSMNQRYFRNKLALVSQEPVLFACSIKDNITYGKNASMEQVIEVSQKANAHQFITSFEDQYDTLVGEKGIRLSGGQKQRVAIARALLMDPAVLLLDEATSALDAESEHLVQQAIDNAMKNRTVLVVAHRLSTVRNADKVIVIDKGVIAEEGTHDSLLQANGVYKKLVVRQLSAAKNVMDEQENLINLSEESENANNV